MRVVFAGTPEFAVASLLAALRSAEVVAVYTQPDRPAGRGRQLAASPVKQVAMARGIPVFQPESFKSAQARAQLRAFQPDLMIVVAYGLILSQSVLDIPRYGCWNVHASLLPRWRGAAPIQRAIEAGDTQTGICLMQMDKGLDTGPVILSQAIAIESDDTGGSLHDRLAEKGAEVLEDGLRLLRAGIRPLPRAQAEQGVTYAHKLEKAEARLDWNEPSERLARKVRAFNPWPVSEAMVAGERLRIHAATSLPLTHNQPSGKVLAASKAGVDIACSEGALRLLRVQREGGRPMSSADYLNAQPALRKA
ncbi:methionyl-tRNA formyltransferase [Arenimonas sp.]|uniref:methionyl-tRNA formyltransferase n=1 Tax=Arenimonas sp. TaxID=1872635 RepID=UPI0039E5216A